MSDHLYANTDSQACGGLDRQAETRWKPESGLDQRGFYLPTSSLDSGPVGCSRNFRRHHVLLRAAPTKDSRGTALQRASRPILRRLEAAGTQIVPVRNE